MTSATVGDVLVVLAAIPAAASVVVFSRVTWWRSRWGRHLMAYMASLGFVLGLGVIRLIFGDARWFADLRIAAFATTVVVLWWRLIYLVQALTEGSPDESPDDT